MAASGRGTSSPLTKREKKYSKPLFGFVALLDILGTKGKWRNAPPGAFLARWETATKMVKGTIPILRKRNPSVKIRISRFSDTLLIIVEGEEDFLKGLSLILLLLEFSFLPALAMGIFLRGAVSFGNFYATSDQAPLIVGPTIDDAASWYEVADWIGVIMCPKIGYKIDYLRKKGSLQGAEPSMLHKYEVPRRSTDITYANSKLWSFAWPKSAHLTKLVGKDPKARILNRFAQELISPEIEKKYINTIRFFEEFHKN